MVTRNEPPAMAYCTVPKPSNGLTKRRRIFSMKRIRNAFAFSAVTPRSRTRPERTFVKVRRGRGSSICLRGVYGEGPAVINAAKAAVFRNGLAFAAVSEVDELRSQLRQRGYLSHGIERWFALDPWSSRACWLELVLVALKAGTLIAA